MKIAIVTDRKTLGGVEKIAIEQVKALRKIGVDATLVILRREKALEENYRDLISPSSILYLDDRLPGWLKFNIKFPVFHFFALFHITYPFILPWFIKKNEFDYVIAHGTSTSFSTVAWRVFKGIPFSTFIWDPIGYILNRIYKEKFPAPVFMLLKWMAQGLDLMIAKTADVVLVGGLAHNKYLKKLYPAVKIRSIPPSVHIPKKRNIKRKNQLLLLTAWKQGKKAEYLVELLPTIPKVPVKLVGAWVDKNYKKQIEDLFKEKGLLSQVEIVGAVSEKELSHAYAESSVFLQINDDRGFGMPALEAAAHGTPFVIPKGQGVCALFKNGEDGYFVKETDTKAISHHLTYLLSNPQFAREMGRKAQEKSTRYSWEQHARLLLELATKYS